jgi:Arc/MetJ family transcription regulator
MPTIEFDNDLLRAAMRVTGLPPPETVNEALRRLVLANERHTAIMNVVGIDWVGDLDEMRRGPEPVPNP